MQQMHASTSSRRLHGQAKARFDVLPNYPIGLYFCDKFEPQQTPVVFVARNHSGLFVRSGKQGLIEQRSPGKIIHDLRMRGLVMMTPAINLLKVNQE